MSKTDKIFINTCERILNSGYSTKGDKVRAKWPDGTPAYTLKEFGIVNTYDLREEFPALTLRPVPLKSAFTEILWIYNKKSSNINDLGLHIWDEWADEFGSIGKAYGYQLGIKYKFNQGYMDQVDNVLWQLKNAPQSRRIMTNIYNFADLHEMNLEPCAYSMTFNVTGDTLNGILNQRSNDILVANAWNVSQYALLLMMFAQVSNLKPGKLIHVISDAHIYDKHVDIVKELITRKQFDAPKITLNPDIKNFYDFKPEDLIIENYKHNEQIKNIPVAI